MYTVEDDEAKARRANEILDLKPMTSVQTLNEFANVALNKFKLSWEDVRDGLEHVTECCEILPVTWGVHIKALEIAENHLINIFDANIIAAAELSGCDVLYTEDLNDGQRIGRVTIRNPFV